MEHLQETGVGRTVNNLRKYDGEVGYASKALVSKWKTMVATEEAENDSHDEEGGGREQMQEESHEDNDDDEQDEEEGENQLQIDETENIDPIVESSDDYQERHGSNTDSAKSHENHHRKSSSKHASEKKHKAEKKNSHKDRDRTSSPGTQKESSSRKERDSSREHKRHKEEKKSKSSETKSLTKHHSSSSSKDSNHKSDSHSSKKSSKSDPSDESPKEERRKKHESKKESRSHESSKKSSKKDKDKDDKDGKKRKRETNEFTIDSTMGASFADALGMLDMPSSSSSTKNKKHLSERPSTSTSQVPSTSSSTASTGNSTTKKPSYSTTSSSNNSHITPTKKLMAEPELLTKRPKLEPLPEIVADIPAPTFTISNNYKPMPLNQTVMDCVFNQSSKPMRQMTEEEQLIHSISSNKSRTKVFSGAKSGAKAKVETLFDLCIRILQEHIDCEFIIKVL